MLFALAASLSHTAWATPPAASAEKEALALFTEGAERYREGRFAEAASLFEKAFALKPEPVLKRNLARAYEGMDGRASSVRAVQAYREYLRLEPHTPDRGAIEQRIRAIEDRVQQEDRLAQQRDSERVRAEKAERDAAAKRTKPHAVPWVMAGLGATGVASAVVIGLVASSKHETASDPATDAMTAERAQQSAQSLATISNVTLVAGGVLLVAGLSWAIVESSSRSPKSVAVSWRGSGVRLAIGF